MYTKVLSTGDTITKSLELTGIIKTLGAKKFSFLFLMENANYFFM